MPVRFMHEVLELVVHWKSSWRVDKYKDEPSQWPEYREEPWRHRERRHPYLKKYQRLEREGYGFAQIMEIFKQDWLMVNRVFAITLLGFQKSLAEEHEISMGSQEFEELMDQKRSEVKQALAEDKALAELMSDLQKITGRDLTVPSQRAQLLEAALAYLEHDFYDFISSHWTKEEHLGWKEAFRDLILHPKRLQKGLGKELLYVIHDRDFQKLREFVAEREQGLSAQKRTTKL